MIVGEMEANCYLLQSKNEICLIDPGGDGPLIIDNIRKSGLRLKYIINTHYHDDHSAENHRVKEKCGGKILIHQAEKDFVDFQVDGFLKEEDVINFGNARLKVLHTPGHSAGSICLLHDNHIFTGDTVFLNGCGRWDLLGGSEKDLEESLLRLSEIIKPGMIIYSGHGESFVMR